ncbi:hypothetical protein QJQ45_000566 [Haematococcus lacustris]|nr:hypothetical protein QJQ45_000566 [Haematococcus lacustris]
MRQRLAKIAAACACPRLRRVLCSTQQAAYPEASLRRSERALLGSLLLGFLLRDLFSLHVADQLDEHGQLVYSDIPVSKADIPDLKLHGLPLLLQVSNATDQPYAIRVKMTMVVGPNETLVTFLPREWKSATSVYAPLTVSVPSSAASPLANLEVLNLYNSNSSSPPTPVDVGGAALVYGLAWHSWNTAYASGKEANSAMQGVWEALGGAPGLNPSPLVPSLSHAVTALAAASTAANATLEALGDLVAAIAGLAETVVVIPGRLGGVRGAPGLRASSLAGQSLVVAAELLASGANSALAAAAALGANVDTLVPVTAAQQAAAHATRANILAKSFSNSMPATSAIAALPPPVTTGAAGAVPEVAVAAAEAGVAAQAAVKAAGSGSLQDAVNAAWMAAKAAASAVSKALAIALAAAPEDKPVRIQSDTNATFVTRRDATSVAQAVAAAASCGSAAAAVMASAALVAQEVLPSAGTRGRNSNISATPAGLEYGGMLNLAARAASAANDTSTAALGVVTVATNPNPSPSPSPNPSPSPPSSRIPSFTPIDNALYATGRAAAEVFWVGHPDRSRQAWLVSIGINEGHHLYGVDRPYAFSGPSPKPVAIIAAPSSSCPARLVAVRDASELPAFKDGTEDNVTSFFDNSTGVVTSQGMVWLNTYTILGNASTLPGMLASTLPTTTAEDIQGLSGCPLGTDLDRLMWTAAGHTGLEACSSSSRSALPWRAWIADHSLVSAATSNNNISSSSLAEARTSFTGAQAVISLEVKVDSALASLNIGNASTKSTAFVGSNRWPLTNSLTLQRVPQANNQTAPAVLLLAGAPYFVVPELLLEEDDLSSGTGSLYSPCKTYTSWGNAITLPGMLASTLPTTTAEDIQGLSGCPLGTDLDRLLRTAAGHTSVEACSSSSRSMLPCRAVCESGLSLAEEWTGGVEEEWRSPDRRSGAMKKTKLGAEGEDEEGEDEAGRRSQEPNA